MPDHTIYTKVGSTTWEDAEKLAKQKGVSVSELISRLIEKEKERK